MRVPVASEYVIRQPHVAVRVTVDEVFWIPFEREESEKKKADEDAYCNEPYEHPGQTEKIHEDSLSPLSVASIFT